MEHPETAWNSEMKRGIVRWNVKQWDEVTTVYEEQNDSITETDKHRKIWN